MKNVLKKLFDIRVNQGFVTEEQIVKNLKCPPEDIFFNGDYEEINNFVTYFIAFFIGNAYNELQEKNHIPNQIIGHTPVKSVYYDNEANHYFIDTHSTYSDGTPIGDKSYLMWNDTEFLVVNNV